MQATYFEDAIRNAVSIGGDSDIIAGAIAEAMFGIPKRIVASAISFLPDDIADIVDTFETKFGTKIIE